MTGRERLHTKYHLEVDFVPSGDDVDTDIRTAWALEYIAFHVGQMNRRLDDALTIHKRMGPAGRGG